MKKVTTLLIALSLAITSVSAQTADDNASKIIDMTNSVVDLYNSYLPHLKKVRTGLSRAEENAEILSENINRSASSWDCAYILMRSDYKADFEKNAKAAPSFPEKASIEAGIKYIAENTERLSNHCQAFSSYFSKKEYKEDTDWKKYEELYNNLDAAYHDISEMWSKTTKLASEAGDRSEILLLKGSPIAEFVIPMKTDLSLAEKIMDMFAEEEVDNASVKQAIEALKKDIEKNKQITGKNITNLEKYSSKARYESYYLSMSGFVEIAEKLEKLMDPANEMDENKRNEQVENTYSSINYKYNSLVDSYNSF